MSELSSYESQIYFQLESKPEFVIPLDMQQPQPLMAYSKKPAFLNSSMISLPSQSTSASEPQEYFQQIDCPPLSYSPQSSVVSPAASVGSLSPQSIFAPTPISSASATPDHSFQQQLLQQQQQQDQFQQQSQSQEQFLISFDGSLSSMSNPLFQDATTISVPTLESSISMPADDSFENLFASTTPSSEVFCDPKTLALPEQSVLISNTPATTPVLVSMPIQAPQYIQSPQMSNQQQPLQHQLSQPQQTQLQTQPILPSSSSQFCEGFQINIPQEFLMLQSHSQSQITTQQIQAHHSLNTSPITPISPVCTLPSNDETTAPVFPPEAAIQTKFIHNEITTFPTPSPSPVSHKRTRAEFQEDFLVEPVYESNGEETTQSNEVYEEESHEHATVKKSKLEACESQCSPLSSPLNSQCHEEHDHSCSSDSCAPSPASSQSSIDNSSVPSVVYRRGRKPTSVDDSSKTFMCQHCSRKFRRQEHLKRHFRSLHTREKPFGCKQCGKTFSRSDNLAQHARTHAKQTVPSEKKLNSTEASTATVRRSRKASAAN